MRNASLSLPVQHVRAAHIRVIRWTHCISDCHRSRYLSLEIALCVFAYGFTRLTNYKTIRCILPMLIHCQTDTLSTFIAIIVRLQCHQFAISHIRHHIRTLTKYWISPEIFQATLLNFACPIDESSPFIRLGGLTNHKMIPCHYAFERCRWSVTAHFHCEEKRTLRSR